LESTADLFYSKHQATTTKTLTAIENIHRGQGPERNTKRPQLSAKTSYTPKTVLVTKDAENKFSAEVGGLGSDRKCRKKY